MAVSLTLKKVILSLKNNPTAKGQYNQFFSNYVELSRVPGMNGLYLLEEIEMNDLDFHPPGDLIAEMERLHQLEQETLSS